MAENLINISGPTATFPGDPNDFSGGAGAGSSWDWNSFYQSTTNSLGGIFGGIAQIIGATRGNQVVIGPGGQTLPAPNQGFAPQQQPVNYTPIIAIGVVVLIIIVMIVLLLKSGK